MKDYNKFIEDAKLLFERFSIIENFHDIKLPTTTGSYIAIKGDYFLNRKFEDEIFQHHFNICIILEKTGQLIVPIVLLQNENKPYGFEHIYSDNTCCLGLTYEVVSIWGSEQTAHDFFDRILDIFLINLLSFRKNKHFITGERPHGKDGVLDYYKNIFNIDNKQCYKILLYLYDKVKKHDLAKGHNKCPCGSGKKIRNCHGDKFKNFLSDLYFNDELKKAFLQDMSCLV